MNSLVRKIKLHVHIPHPSQSAHSTHTSRHSRAHIHVRETQHFIDGELIVPVIVQPPYAGRGIVIFVTPSSGDKFAQAGDAAQCFHQHSFGTLVIDLLTASDARFADADLHLPLLTARLLAVITELAHLIERDVLPPQPIALYAAYHATPLAVRAAAIRDRNITALSCHSGMIDLAGRQYLQELKAPLQMLLDATDETATRNLLHAQPYTNTPITVQPLPITNTAEQTARLTAKLAADWLEQQFKDPLKTLVYQRKNHYSS